jgi:hypothetical protein
MAARVKKIFYNLSEIYNDPDRKSIAIICWEFIKCSISSRSIAYHYLTSFLYRRDVNNIYDYISVKEEKKVQKEINDPKLSDIITNKLMFVEHFKRGGISVPNLIGYNILDKLYLRMPDRWESVDILSLPDFISSMQRVIHTWRIKSIFLKPIRGSQGTGAYKIDIEQLNLKKDIIGVHSSLTQSYYVIQEVVEQHQDLSSLNSNSLNTMRVDTFRAPSEKAEILSGFLRVGGKNSYVDNISAGGVLVGINLENGVLREKAINKFHGNQKIGTFKLNPVTGIPFEGFKIPYFNEVKKIVIQAAEWIPSALVGWDVAVSSSGPVLIEANVLYYGMSSLDMVYGGYKNNPVYIKARAYAYEK